MLQIAIRQARAGCHQRALPARVVAFLSRANIFFKNFLQNQKRITKISCELVTRYYILWSCSKPKYKVRRRNTGIGALEQ
jgi:hypothetical protein